MGPVIAVLTHTGIRAQELCDLRWPQDVVEAGDRVYLHVRGKGRRDRHVPISRNLHRQISDYVRLDRPKDAKSDRLFVAFNRSPRTGDYEPISPSGILQMVRAVAQDAGITKRTYSHILRHSFATDFLRQGGEGLLLARILGHSSLRLIDQTYGHLVNTDLSRAMDEYERTITRSESR